MMHGLGTESKHCVRLTQKTKQKHTVYTQAIHFIARYFKESTREKSLTHRTKKALIHLLNYYFLTSQADIP